MGRDLIVLLVVVILLCVVIQVVDLIQPRIKLLLQVVVIVIALLWAMPGLR